MTGREVILHIIENKLEDRELFDAVGKPFGMMTPEEAAEKFDVQPAMIFDWMQAGKLRSFLIGDSYYIPESAANPNIWSRKTEVKNNEAKFYKNTENRNNKAGNIRK